MSVSSLGYIGLHSKDLGAWEHFAPQVLGLMPSLNSTDKDSLQYRMDDHPFRLIIEKGDADKLNFVGWEFSNANEYEAVIARLEASGASVARGDAAGAEKRCVSEYASSSDPDGNPFEIYHTRTHLSDDFVSPLDISKFVTGDMGMGHIVLPAPQTDKTHAFYKDVLGFGDSDDLQLPPPAEGAPPMRVIFMHAANARHHSLGLFNYPTENGIVHMILEVPEVDEVGACLDRVEKAGYPLMATLGRHCNDNMLSFYVSGPGGINIEYGCGGLQIDWKNYTPTISTQGDIWGHAYQPPA